MKNSLRSILIALGMVMACSGAVQARTAKPHPSTKASVKQAAKPPVKVAAKPKGKERKTVAVTARADPKKKAGAGAAARRTAKAAAVATVVAVPSFGEQQGLHSAADPLSLQSSVALVVDQDTNEVLLAKNPNAVLPIASITKLMTGLLIVEAGQSMDETISITRDDIDTEKGSRSRLAPGTQLTRGEALHLALMSSENRAANALSRHYPGGEAAFVAAMNRKAAKLGMKDTSYVEPTGLSSKNQSSAKDLAILVKEAHKQPLLRELSTSTEAQVAVGKKTLNFHTTNRLVASPNWDIGLQKTGYIAEAGRCLVMQAQMAGRKMIMVLLDSAGKYSRLADAERIRHWLDSHPGMQRQASNARAAAMLE